MKTFTLIVIFMVAISTYAQENVETSKKIIALEKAALERWNNGDVYGFLDLSAEDVVYFDPMLEKRVDGLKKLTKHIYLYKGK